MGNGINGRGTFVQDSKEKLVKEFAEKMQTLQASLLRNKTEII